jgi:hypothetical protein
LKNIFDGQETLLTADFDKEASDIKAHVDMKHSILKHKADGDHVGLGAVAHEKRAVGHGQQQFVCGITMKMSLSESMLLLLLKLLIRIKLGKIISERVEQTRDIGRWRDSGIAAQLTSTLKHSGTSQQRSGSSIGERQSEIGERLQSTRQTCRIDEHT